MQFITSSSSIAGGGGGGRGHGAPPPPTSDQEFFFFFLFKFFLLFTFQNNWNLFWYYQYVNFLLGKSISHWEKIMKNDFAPSEQFSCYAPDKLPVMPLTSSKLRSDLGHGIFNRKQRSSSTQSFPTSINQCLATWWCLWQDELDQHNWFRGIFPPKCTNQMSTNLFPWL